MGLGHFSFLLSFFHGAMLFSLVFVISGECNIQSSLEKPSPLGPSYIQIETQEDTWLVLGTHFLKLLFAGWSVKSFTVDLAVTRTHNVYTLSVTLPFSPQTH